MYIKTRLQTRTSKIGIVYIENGANEEQFNYLLRCIEKTWKGIKYYNINREKSSHLEIKYDWNLEKFNIKGKINLIYNFLTINGLDYLIEIYNELVKQKKNKCLSKEKYKYSIQELKTKNHTCPICLSDSESKFVKTRCNHIFHDKCLSEWLMKKCKEAVCPLCKFNFNNNCWLNRKYY